MISGILNIKKEAGFTSHDVVAKLRGIVHQKKIGHTGTLDPDATGVLPVCLGKATKLCDIIGDWDKTYEAVLLLGKETDTEDTSGKILEEKGGEAEIRQWNVADFVACERAVKDIVKTHGSIDILVNNAGITKDGLLMGMSEADFDSVIDVNLKGTFNMMRFVSRQMLRQRCGRIISMASVVGIAGNAGQANYAASKAGIIGMTKSAARELASRGVTVNAVAPGFIETEMTAVLSEEVKKASAAQIPLGHFGKPEDIAKTVAFLASDDAAYITGQVIQVDGGMVI